MAKTSSVEKNNRRRRLAKKYAGKRARLKAITKNQTCRWKSASLRSSNWRNCRAIPRRTAFATAAS